MQAWTGWSEGESALKASSTAITSETAAWAAIALSCTRAVGRTRSARVMLGRFAALEAGGVKDTGKYADSQSTMSSQAELKSSMGTPGWW